MNIKPRLGLTLRQQIIHYSPVVIGLIPTPFPIYFSIIIVLLLFILQYRRLYFKKIDIVCTDEQFNEAVRRTTGKLDLHIDKSGEDFIQASVEDFFLWGEMITIVRRNGYILINSICSPNKWPAITSYGKNRKYRNAFLQNLNNVINEVEYVPKVETAENELSFKRMIFRIIMYPVCLLLIFAGIMMIYEHITPKNALAGVGLIALAVIILYSDIKLLIKYLGASK